MVALGVVLLGWTVNISPVAGPGTQVTVKVVEAVLPAGTVTVCVAPPLTVQFSATASGTTVVSPASSPAAGRQAGEGDPGAVVARDRLARSAVHRDHVAVRVEARAGGVGRNRQIAGRRARRRWVERKHAGQPRTGRGRRAGRVVLVEPAP